ncbi:lysoplasmalogenase [Parasphaerochaeta coccoides]|uniref:YhhN family protein n=1 Tax=Parasphaerochaeta coccoides (strain ATCC BAA-1237 / DSM 17374 / SPN1) TaxID=760011 RepID=F4GHF7_PARC1|nr:lysoplasmalogenase [Parasphaerochaeta coccoides]AEC02546.1 YhhN family protein [Parasphaerochaeta coccoides DSM 17374]
MSVYIILVFTSYIIASIVNVWGRHKRDDLNNYLSKPLLMPLLAIGYALVAGSHMSWIIIAALVLCAIGDVFLMLPEKKADKPVLFPLGMLAFMSGHLCYFSWYVMYTRSAGFTGAWATGIFAFLAGIAVIVIILKKLNAGKFLPLFVLYTVIIMLNVAGAIGTWGTGSISGTVLCTVGAFLFVFSDAMIAFDVLGKPMGGPDVVMITYTIAQLMLVVGIITLSV